MNILEFHRIRLNTEPQVYEGVILRCVYRADYAKRRAKLFTVNETEHTIWIPNKHLSADGTICWGEDIDYVFRSERNQYALRCAGVDTHKFLRVHDIYPNRNRRSYPPEFEDWINATLNG